MRWPRAVLVFVGLLPWLETILPPDLRDSFLRRGIDAAFSALCHHAPDRTLELRGSAMTVCSRCAGVYFGLFLAAVWRWPASLRWLRAAFTVGAALLALDVLSQDLGLHAPSHVVRLLTGAIVGWAATAWMLLEVEPRVGAARDVPVRQGAVGGGS